MGAAPKNRGGSLACGVHYVAHSDTVTLGSDRRANDNNKALQRPKLRATQLWDINMQTETAILAPAAVLAGWTMIVFIWLLARRVPAFSAAGVKLGEMPVGMRGVDGEEQMPAKANWVSHNYTHLMEQPTVFYPVVIILALLGDNSSLSVNLAWAYTGLRVVHSFWQANVNTIPVRFALFGLSSLCLIILAARAALQAL